MTPRQETKAKAASPPRAEAGQPTFGVKLGGQTVEFRVQAGLLEEAGRCVGQVGSLSPGCKTVVVTDKRVGERYGRALLESLGASGFEPHLFSIEPGEGSKSLGVVAEIYSFLAGHCVGRDAVIVALGGGVVSDVAGFAAATWMRGLRWVVFPTTLEAAVDASIGGKTGVNLPEGKNLVGAFHQPMLVGVDPAFLRTLDKRDVRAGLAESIKHALLCSEEMLSWHESHRDEILALEETVTTELILWNIRFKTFIVEQDCRELGDRRVLLNLGHTIGHAIENESGYALRHGECVALGTVAACRLSQSLSLLNSSTVERVTALLASLGLPTKLNPTIPTDRIMDSLRRDKKIRDGKLRFVLLEGVGRPIIRDDVPERAVCEAYESLLS